MNIRIYSHQKNGMNMIRTNICTGKYSNVFEYPNIRHTLVRISILFQRYCKDCLRMSLADELMADLEGSDEEEEAEVKEEDEEMDSEDIKPSKLELEQVFLDP